MERAIHHGLKESLVKEYMTTEFSVVSPDAPFFRIREFIIGQNQSLLPVVEGDQLVGTISVGDLMRSLQEELVKTIKGPSILEGQPLYARKKVISKLMGERFSERVQNLLKEFGRVGDELGYSVYAVGGFVRDLLMGVENYDLDIVVEGDGIKFAEEFEKRHPCRIRTHKKFGTAIILLPNRFKGRCGNSPSGVLRCSCRPANGRTGIDQNGSLSAGLHDQYARDPAQSEGFWRIDRLLWWGQGHQGEGDPGSSQSFLCRRPYPGVQGDPL